MNNLSLNYLLLVRDSFAVTYIVKDYSSKQKLKAYLKENDIDPLHKIVIYPKLGLEGNDIGYRLEAPIMIEKNFGKIVV